MAMPEPSASPRAPYAPHVYLEIGSGHTGLMKLL